MVPERRSEDTRLARIEELMQQIALDAATTKERHRSYDEKFLALSQDIRALVDKISGWSNTASDLTRIEKTLIEDRKAAETEWRLIKHDIIKMGSNEQAIKIHSEKIGGMESRLSVLETMANKTIGGAQALSKAGAAFWTVCGGGIVALIGYILYAFFHRVQP